MQEARSAVSTLKMLVAPLRHITDGGQIRDMRGRCDFLSKEIEKFTQWLRVLTKHQRRDDDPPPPQRRKQGNHAKRPRQLQKQTNSRQSSSTAASATSVGQPDYRLRLYQNDKDDIPPDHHNELLAVNVFARPKKKSKTVLENNNEVQLNSSQPPAIPFKWRSMPDQRRLRAD